MRAQGLEPWTYGLKVLNENSTNGSSESAKTNIRSTEHLCPECHAQQKAQHFQNKRQQWGINDRYSSRTISRGSLPEFIANRWNELPKEIQTALVELASFGLRTKSK